MGYTKAYSERLVCNYTEAIEIQKKKIVKNFEQMDFENAQAKNECSDIVDAMINNCNRLISEIKGYSFN